MLSNITNTLAAYPWPVQDGKRYILNALGQWERDGKKRHHYEQEKGR